MSSVSILAAISCSLRLVPAARRLNRLVRRNRRRGRDVSGSMSSQSPTVALDSSSPALPVNGRISVSMEGPATRMRSRCTAITRTGTAGSSGSSCEAKKEFQPKSANSDVCDIIGVSPASALREGRQRMNNKATPPRAAGASGIRPGQRLRRRSPLGKQYPASECGVAIRAPPAGWTQRQSPTSPSSHLPSARMCRYRRAKSSIGPVRSYHALILLARVRAPADSIRPFDCDCRRCA